MAQNMTLPGNFANNINSFNSINYVVNINTTVTDGERRQILEWLSPLEPQQRHHAVRTNRFDGVGYWLLETTEFQKWSNSNADCDQAVLFCYGNPGVGKTHLSSLVIDYLCDQAGGKDIAVAGLYCDFKDQQEQSASNMLGAILKQLVNRGETPEHVQQAFQKAKKEFGGRSLRLPDMVDILKKTIALLPQVFICLDALDESAPGAQLELFRSLQDIVQESPSTRLFLTGRPHIQKVIEKRFSQAVIIPINPSQEDIQIFLEMSLDRDPEPDAMDDNLRADIMRIIPTTISAIFLLVSLNIDAILGETTIHQRRKKLHQMTKGNGLKDAYAATLARIKAQKGSRSRLGMDILMWLSHSERPLQADELCHALGVEIGSSDLNTENIPTIQTLLGCSLGLVTVEVASSTIRLVHYTLQEYLSDDTSLFHSPHSMIAEVCLTYLNFQCVRDLSPTLCSVPPTTPLVGYASCYWGAHATREMTSSVKSLALKLLDGFDKHISSKLLVLREMGWLAQTLNNGHTLARFTGLHGAACLGLVDITVALLEIKKWDPNASDFNGDTPVAWAARKGHKELLEVLLEQSDVNPDTTNEGGDTPLLLAASGRHEEALKLLLNRADVNPNTKNAYGNTPLSRAVWEGHEGVVKILLSRNDVNPNTRNEDGDTPLLLAASEGHEGVVKILLGRDGVDPNERDKYIQTPLLLAASRGHRGVVKILLERNDVNPDTRNEDGDTPLLLAAWEGHEGVVKILLECNDVNPDPRNEDGDTPLLLATSRGHRGVVEILLARNDTNPNIADRYYHTPLMLAASNGHEAIVKMLLERNDVDPYMANEAGTTPLLLALSKRHEEIVKILSER